MAISKPISGRRTAFTTKDCVLDLWTQLKLPVNALSHLKLEGGDDVAIPSSFKIGHLAQSSIAVSGLLAALIYAHRGNRDIPEVTVERRHAVAEFQSEKLYSLDGVRSKPPWGLIGGLHRTSDGYVRLHDSFPNHRSAALRMLGCTEDATKDDVVKSIKARNALELEDAAVDAGAVVYALRSYDEWIQLPQAKVLPEFPIMISKVSNSASTQRPLVGTSKSLTGIRVLEMARVIAAPVAGRTLAAHGADVMWVTSPNLPDLPDLDRDFSRGKRTVQLDINNNQDKELLLQLLDEADVFLQSYRPGSLAGRGFSLENLLARRQSSGRPLIYATLSAWGTEGPWGHRRGFDSIVQTVSGTNVAEAERFGDSSTPRPLPCQALDHGSGHLLAAGIMAALHRQSIEGGSYQVDISLAGVMKYLKSLGQYEDKSCFECGEPRSVDDIPEDFTEIRSSGFGTLKALKHAARLSGVEVGYAHMPKPLGSDIPAW